MILNLNQVEANQLKHEHYDVCIVGSGPAGISVARKLAINGIRIALLEAGGLEYSKQSQDIYDGKSIGLEEWGALSGCRLRYFGGTSNHWAGRCSYFDPQDFADIHYSGMSGWPIKYQEVMQYLSEASKIVDLKKDGWETNYDKNWPGASFRYSDKNLSPPTRFSSKFHDEIESTENIDLFINANLVDIKLDENTTTVNELILKNYKNQTFKFKAKEYIIAAGAVENARLLLNSNSVIQQGIGNQTDIVGRCFMEHFNIEFGRFVADDLSYWPQTIELNPTSMLMKELNIGNGVLAFQPNYNMRSYGRFKELKSAMKSFACGSKFLTDTARKIANFNCPGDGVITSLLEQSPNLSSRVFLDTEVDTLGLNKIVLDWRSNSHDLRTIRKLGKQVAMQMAKHSIARVQLNKFILDENEEIEEYGYHCHQMGTTRMASSHKDGVVDENCKVYGTDNLYIAGSSIFPTGGGCNPTLTIVMLSLRLAEHLKTKII
jgi:choline dehydrogenase-like flavoprotein